MGNSKIEQWRDVVGYESRYMVSNAGRIMIKHRIRKITLYQGEVDAIVKEKILLLQTDRRGYKRAAISNGVKRTLSLVHRLVALAFIPNQNNLCEVNHKNGDKSNNNLHNLEWISGIENMRHSWKIGLRKIEAGEKHPRAMLTNKQVEIIYKSKKSCLELSKKYNITRQAIYNIKLKKTWSSVTDKL